jgi:predicted DCC family thiol-disulfide oxidoreductase YuxK
VASEFSVLQQPDGSGSAPEQTILLYDGVCGLCNRLVRFVLQRDRRDCFRFASLQGEVARAILRRHGLRPGQLDTLYVVLHAGQEAELLLARSEAARYIFRRLGGFWAGLSRTLGVLPVALSDWGYNRVANQRYRVFGKYDACPLPEAKDRHKFLD